MMPGTGFLIPRKLSRKATTLRSRSNGHFLVAQSILSTQNASRFLCLQFHAEAEVTLYHDLAILEILTLRALTGINLINSHWLVGWSVCFPVYFVVCIVVMGIFHVMTPLWTVFVIFGKILPLPPIFSKFIGVTSLGEIIWVSSAHF